MDDRLIHNDEKSLYIVCLVLSILTYISLIISIVGIVYILIGMLITMMIHGIAIGHIRTNGVKITEKQFPEIYHQTKKIALDMGVTELPDIYIMESGGTLNAFATSFLGRKFIVLYSEIVELTKDNHHDELNFVIAHELAHIKRNHITQKLLILPSLWIPFLGNAYSRACEYTCDRMAAAYIHSPKGSVNALAILAVGKQLFSDIDIVEYIQTSKAENGFFVWFSQILSTHPPLPKRIAEIQHFNTMSEVFKVAKAE